MSDELSDAECAQREAQAAAISEALQSLLWRVIDDPQLNWARVPHCVGHALAETLTRVLVALAHSDPNDVAFGLKMISEVERQFVTRTGAATSTSTH
jgi:hypothetical protein